MYKNSILDVGATAAHDDSIVKRDFYTYTPYTNTFNESEEIRIAIQNQDLCLLPSESYLYMQVKVSTENNNDTVADKDKVKFVHNFASFLFSDARYELNGVEIDRNRNVGITSTMKLLAASCKSNTSGYYQYNKTFAGKVAQRAEAVVYDLMLPLSIWFGFCDDFRKVILNSRHELILTRSRNSLNCFYGGLKDAGSAEVKIELSRIEWKMPYITLADNVKMSMNNIISKHIKLPIQHRTWDLYEYPELPQTKNHIWSVKAVSQFNKPRYVFVTFQHGKNEKKVEEASRFSSVNVNSVRLYLNSSVFPYHMNDLDVSQAKYAELYQAYESIQQSYYNGEEGINQFGNGFGAFQADVMFAFDTSRSDESHKNGTIDIRLEIKASANIPSNTTAYCLIIYENEFMYSPADGLVERLV